MQIWNCSFLGNVKDDWLGTFLDGWLVLHPTQITKSCSSDDDSDHDTSGETILNSNFEKKQY